MKKFTKIDEELLKESADAQVKFNEKYELAQIQLEQLKTKLKDLKLDSLVHVNEMLSDFLNSENN